MTLNQDALNYHRQKPYGKLAIMPTKPMDNREDLALAYSPGVAEPCRVIEKDPDAAMTLTARSNLIAVISNGTAVLGLGDIGALASKPVMEGKAVLFKKFSNIDAFDIEIDEKDPAKLIDIIASLEPTFGGINLEDIKAPDCFEIEKKLKERMKIPVFHDDQHGTAVIVSAATLNALELIHKKLEDITIVVSGAGAGALACLNLLCELGAKKSNIIVCDSKGVIHHERHDVTDPYKLGYQSHTDKRTLRDALQGADMFLGLSMANVADGDMIKSMAPNPLVFALANPDPEIHPDEVLKVRQDAIIATGRSDYPNQVNNALCFPYLFRGALDVGATCINEEMKIAAVRAIASLAKAETTDVVANAYGGAVHRFGKDYIIPKPFDRRLYVVIATAVAKAAMETGVARRPIVDFDHYHHELESFIYRSSAMMRPIFQSAIQGYDQRLCFADGEDNRVLQTIQSLKDRGMQRCIVIGRPDVIKYRIDHLGLRYTPEDIDIVDPNHDPRFQTYWQTYYDLMKRKGITPETAKMHVRSNNTVIASLMLHLKDADAVICGLVGRYVEHFRTLRAIVGLDTQHSLCASLTAAILDQGPVFFCDPYLNADPTWQDMVHMIEMSIQQLDRFGLAAKIALVSHSNFGTSPLPSAVKMRKVLQEITQKYPHLEIEGEMHAHLALDEEARRESFPHSRLKGSANLLVFPTVEAAHISYNLIKSITKCPTLDPILMGLNGVAHILNPNASARTVLNMAALAIGEGNGLTELKDKAA